MPPSWRQAAVGWGAGVLICSVKPPPRCQLALGIALQHICHGQVAFISGVRTVSAAWTTGSYHVSYSYRIKAAVLSSCRCKKSQNHRISRPGLSSVVLARHNE